MPTPPSRYLPLTLGARNPIQRTPKLSSSISARGAPSHHLKLISGSTRRKSGLASGSAGAGVLPGARYTWPLKEAVLKYSPWRPLWRSALFTTDGGHGLHGGQLGGQFPTLG